MKRFFTFLNILELLSLSLFLLLSILYLFDLGRTTIGKIISDYLGDTILWLNFVYGWALELLTIPIALIMHFTNKTPFTYRIVIKSPCKYILHTYKGKYNLDKGELYPIGYQTTTGVYVVPSGQKQYPYVPSHARLRRKPPPSGISQQRRPKQS